jgi:hypothetical protein
MQAAAPFARLDSDQTWRATPRPGTAGRPLILLKSRPVAGEPKLGHPLTVDADTTGKVRASFLTVCRTDDPTPPMPVFPILFSHADGKRLGDSSVNGSFACRFPFSLFFQHSSRYSMSEGQLLSSLL